MRILSLRVHNFRNLAAGAVEFCPGLNVLLGDNAQGKTNVLEAIYLFRLGRSFRTRRTEELVKRGQEQVLVQVGCLWDYGGAEKLSFQASSDGSKDIKIGSQRISSLTELVGRYPAVLFGPQDLALISGYPEGRRRFLDELGSMIDPAYLCALKNYRRALVQKSTVLRSGGAVSMLGAWNEIMAEEGAKLVWARKGIVDRLQAEMRTWGERLEVPYGFSLKYRPAAEGDSKQELREDLGRTLAEVAEKESRKGMCLVGAHRDEMVVAIDGLSARGFGSQGQKRLAAVLLRLAELSLLEEQLGEKCVLLLDDVFSELDERTCRAMLGLVARFNQTFLTSAIAPKVDAKAQVRLFKVTAGKVHV